MVMNMSIVVGISSSILLFLSTLSYSHPNDVLQGQSMDKVNWSVMRGKRSLVRPIGSILRTAWVKFQTQGYTLFRKTGNYNDAVRDFRKLNPTDVVNDGIRTRGVVGDAYIELHKGEARGAALTILSQNGKAAEKLVIEYIPRH